MSIQESAKMLLEQNLVPADILQWNMHVYANKKSFHFSTNCPYLFNTGKLTTVTVEDLLPKKCSYCNYLAQLNNPNLNTAQKANHVRLATVIEDAMGLHRTTSRINKMHPDVSALEKVIRAARHLSNLETKTVCEEVAPALQRLKEEATEGYNNELDAVKEEKLSNILKNEVFQWDAGEETCLLAYPNWWADGGRGRTRQAVQLFIEHLPAKPSGGQIAVVPGWMVGFIVAHLGGNETVEMAPNVSLTDSQQEVFNVLWPDMILLEALETAKILA